MSINTEQATTPKISLKRKGNGYTYESSCRALRAYVTRATRRGRRLRPVADGWLVQLRIVGRATDQWRVWTLTDAREVIADAMKEHEPKTEPKPEPKPEPTLAEQRDALLTTVISHGEKLAKLGRENRNLRKQLALLKAFEKAANAARREASEARAERDALRAKLARLEG